MTKFEQNQKFSTFLRAGYNAYRMAFSPSYFGFEQRPYTIRNPYTEKPYSDLWQRGWDKAKSEYDRGLPYNPNQFVDNRRKTDYTKERQQKQQSKQQAQQRFKQQKAQGKGKRPQVPQVPQTASPANLQRLSNKFTRKYRTVA